MEWATQALRSVVVATALVAAGPSTASAQGPPPQAQEPSRSSPASVDDHPGADRQPEPPGTIFSRLSLFDRPIASGPKPQSAIESWLSGVAMACVGCRRFESRAWDRSPSTRLRHGRCREHGDGGRPWASSRRGSWAFATLALPLSAAVRPDGALDPAVLSTAGGSASLPGSRWSVTAGVEKTLATRASGASVGITADAVMPVEHDAVGGDDPRTRGFAAATMRVGVVVRW